ncbi:MAG: TonB-dependent receptor [Opitutaceae bacterium]
MEPYAIESRRLEGLDGPAGRSSEIANGGASIGATRELLSEIPGLLQHDNGVRGFTDPVAARGVTSTPIMSSPVIDLRYGEFPIAAAYAVFSAQPAGIRIARSQAGSFESIQSTQPGGRIDIGPQNADAVGPGGLLTVEVGERNAQAIRAEGHGAFAGGTALGFLSWSQDDGRLTNTALDTRPDFKESLHGEARMQWGIGDRSSLVVQLIGEKSDDGVQPLVPLSTPGYKVDRPTEGETGLTNLHFGLAFEHANEALRFTSTTAAQYWNLDPYRGTIVLPPTLFSDLTNRTGFFSQEFQVESLDTSEDTSWTTGLALRGINRTIDVVRSIPGFGPIEWSKTDLNSRGLLANGAVRFKPISGMRPTFGLKVDVQESSMDRVSTVPPAPDVNESQTDTAFLPFLRLDGPIDAGMPWSVSLVSGWKPGGYSSFSDRANLVGFEPERTWTLEGSLASDKERTIEFTAYTTLSNDTQIERSFTETDYLVRNAESTHIYGAELTGHHELREHLTLSGRASWTHAVFYDYIDPFTGTDYSGKKVPYVPEYGLNLGLDYRPDLGFAAGVQIQVMGPVPYEESSDPTFTQDAWVTASAWAGWRWPRAEFTVTGTNLFNDEHWTSIVPGIYHGVPVLPRRLNARFRWFF